MEELLNKFKAFLAETRILELIKWVVQMAAMILAKIKAVFSPPDTEVI